jgi:hypothetical protein
MDGVCNYLFQNISSISVRKKTCTEWFKDALEYCSTSASLYSYFDQLLNWVFEKIVGTADREFDPHHDRRYLSQHICQNLMFDSVREYIEIVPKYDELFVQNMWLRFAVCSVVALFVVSFVRIPDFQWPEWRKRAFDFRKKLKSSKSLKCLKHETPEEPEVCFNKHLEQQSSLLDLINTPLEDVEDVIKKIRHLYQLQAKFRIMIDFKIETVDNVDQFEDSLPETPQPVCVKPCCSMEMIENITEPQEMINGKISCLNIQQQPVVHQVEIIKPMIKPPATPSSGAQRPTSRTPRGGHGWKHRMDEERKLNAKPRHYKRGA